MSPGTTSNVDPSLAPLVVYCSGNSWTNPTGPDIHVASRLAQDLRVLWVDPPLPLRRRNIAVWREPRLRQLDDKLWRLTPKSPPGVTRVGVRDFAAWRARSSIEKAVAELGGPVTAVVVSSLDDYLGVCDAQRRVFFGTDDFLAGVELLGLSRGWARRRESAQLRAATTVVSVSDQLAERWRTHGCDVVVIPNGCDTDHFANTDSAPLAADIELPGPIAGVVGQLNDRIDLGLLEAVADRGVSLLLLGPIKEPVDRRRLGELFDRPNVQWIAERRFDEIPGYMRAISVGLTPYLDTEFNRGSSPLKTIEYLAAGRSVVATDLPAARSLDTEHVDIASSASEFVQFVIDRLGRDDDEARRAERRHFADLHSWTRRVAQFQNLLTDLLG
jgi:teichuronic acid biosynthesis glycosyltransferase TuaH